MGKLRWYRRDPNAALEGMAELTLEERGAYNTVLDLIYTRDGAVEDDAHFIAGWLRCDVRVWRRIRQRLLDLKKIYALGTTLRNERADKEVDVALLRIASAANAGIISAATRANEMRVLKHLATSPVQPLVQLPTITKSHSLTMRSVLSTAPEAVDKPKALQGKRPSDLSRADLDAIIERKSTHDDRGGGAAT